MKLRSLINIGLVCLSILSTTACSGENDDSSKENYAKKYENSDIGDVIEFGSYEQDNNKENGLETIEWIVLAKEDDKLLVISKYCLDVKAYNNENKDVTWETCTIRKWLNDNFYKMVFSKNEAEIILESELTNPDNDEGYYDKGKGGNDTKDKVFLLSMEEVDKYIPTESDRITDATEYARAQGEIFNFWDSGSGIPRWWLRSPGYDADYASCVTEEGDVSKTGIYVEYDGLCIRPALWINVK